MTSTEVRAVTESLTEHLVDLTTAYSARSVSAYLSGPVEPDTRPFLAWAREAGIRVLLPVTREDRMLAWRVDDGGEVEGLFGMPEGGGEPAGPAAINDVDLMLVPAAAVASDGLRLGWGRGYFDKMLASMGKCPPVYAVVFDGELVDEVPRELHDQAVDGAIAPSGIVRFT